MFDLHMFLVFFCLSQIKAHIFGINSVKSDGDRCADADALRSYVSGVLFTPVAEPGELPVTLH